MSKGEEVNEGLMVALLSILRHLRAYCDQNGLPLPYDAELTYHISQALDLISDEKKQEDYSEWLRRRGNRTPSIALNN